MGSCTLIIKKWNLRSYVTSDVCKGGHTWELVSKSFNIPQHFHTYCRITCKVWRYSDALIKLEVFPIYKPLPRGTGSCTSLARCMLVDGMSGSFVRCCSQTRANT